MTVPFWCVLVVVCIPYVLSGLGGVMRARAFGGIDNKNPRAQASRLQGLGARVMAAQANAWEALPVFVAAVVISHLAGIDPELASTLCLVFVAARVAHAAFYLADLDKLRSLAFIVGFGCCVALFVRAG